jgi:Domain of unknown function (DUF6321)
MKSFSAFLDEAGRCWPGHRPVPGKKPYSPGSCVKEEREGDAGGADNPVFTKTKMMKVKKEDYEADDGPLTDEQLEQLEEVAAWQRKEGKSETGGLNRKGIESYRRENPGSKLSMAVTTKPSKLKPGSKAANRRKSFCARMGGMKRRLTSAKTARDPDSRINKALRKWNC